MANTTNNRRGNEVSLEKINTNWPWPRAGTRRWDYFSRRKGKDSANFNDADNELWSELSNRWALTKDTQQTR